MLSTKGTVVYLALVCLVLSAYHILGTGDGVDIEIVEIDQQ